MNLFLSSGIVFLMQKPKSISQTRASRKGGKPKTKRAEQYEPKWAPALAGFEAIIKVILSRSIRRRRFESGLIFLHTFLIKQKSMSSEAFINKRS